MPRALDRSRPFMTSIPPENGVVYIQDGIEFGGDEKEIARGPSLEPPPPFPGADEPIDLAGMGYGDLLALARQRGFEGSKQPRKTDLLAFLAKDTAP